MIKKWKISFPAQTGSEKRYAYVYVPNAAKKNKELRFPVLYMFDGHNVFFDEDATYGKSWGLGEYLDYCDVPLILAAVECSHDPENGRICEYSPFDFSNRWMGDIKGAGRETMEWYIHECKPLIDEKYPTLPDREHTFIAGSSMGGLMSLYALAEYNGVFSRAAALSPSIGFGPEKLDAMLKKADFAPGTVLYMDFGEKEMAAWHRYPGRWRTVNRILLQKGVLLTSRIVPDGEHNETSWEKQNPFFISTLMYGLEE